MMTRDDSDPREIDPSNDDGGSRASRPAWIQTWAREEAEGELAEIYACFGRGPVAHILRSGSINPPVLRAHYDLYRSIMFGPSPLSRAQREMIATVVSQLNQCHY